MSPTNQAFMTHHSKTASMSLAIIIIIILIAEISFSRTCSLRRQIAR